jgi:hypothetical protein
MRNLKTSREIITAIGGPTKFARWWGTSVKCAWAWKERGFPPKTHSAMSERLRKEHGIEAPPSAWGQVELERT